MMLMSLFERILPWAMRHSGTLLFGLIWLTITAAAAISVALAVRRVVAPMRQKASGGSSDLVLIWRQAQAPSVVAMLTLVATFVAFYIALMVAWEAFAYYDDSEFTLATLKGHNIQLWILPESGRFQPLSFQEFNLIRHFTDAITGYQVLPIVELLIISTFILIIDDEISITTRGVLLILVLLTPSILATFTSLLASERSVLLFLVCFALCIKRFEQTESIASAVSAVISAQLMIYSKETAFLLLLGFAVSRLMLRCKNPHLDFGRLWVRESRLDLALASLAVLFLILYFGFIGNGNMNYAASSRLPRADIMLGYMRVDFLPWLLVAVVLGRMYLILRHRVAPLLLWDGLAAGGVAYFLAYIYLSMFRVHYPAPVDLIAVLYVGRFAVLSWKEVPSWAKPAVTALAFVIICQDVLVSAFVVFERKNVIQAKVELASVVAAQYGSRTGNNLRIFFPFAGGYAIMEFGTYLSSRGVPVEGAGDETSGLNSVVLAEARRTRTNLAEARLTRTKNAPGRPAEDGPCVEYRRVWCQIVNGPSPGDLVIVLPDDEASFAEALAYRDEGVLLSYSKPHLPIPQWLHSAFDSLPVGAQGSYRYGKLPDRWMDASVTRWE
jgi:hypothetical protein